MYRFPKSLTNLNQKEVNKKEMNVSLPDRSIGKPNENRDNALDTSPMKLREAIVWSEILGKPMSKRRKRRYYGD